MGKVLVPLGVFLCVRLFFAAAAYQAGYPPFETAIWSRWDTGQYLSIATRGYELMDCARIGYAAQGHCGNTGWMPAYPAAIAATMRFGIAPLRAAIAISAAFELLLLLLLWNGIFVRKNPLALAACALAPGAIYFHAAFPISMCAFFVALCLWLLLHERFVLAGLAGAVAAASYSSGFLVAPVAAIWALSRPDSPARRLANAAVAGGLAAAGFAGVLAWHQAKLGAWNAFFLVQEKYDHQLVSPLARIAAQAQRRDALALAGTETLVVAALFGALAVFCLWRRLIARHLLFFGCGLLFWIFPLCLANVELTRSEALVLPALVLLDEAPMVASVCAFVALLLLAWPIAQLFYRGVLI